MIKTIKIEESTHKKLEAIGNKSETFDDIINKLLDFYKIKKEGDMNGVGAS